MKIRDIVKVVNKSKQFEQMVHISDIAEEMNINVNNYDDQRRLISYYFGDWYCTDSHVGYRVYFFDDEPVAISSQIGRKQNVDIEWLSKDAYMKVREYVLTFEEVQEQHINLCDMDQDLGDTYKISYHSQLYDYHKSIPLLNGINVKITEYDPGKKFNDKKQYEPGLVKIQFDDGRTEWIELEKLDFPYNVTS